MISESQPTLAKNTRGIFAMMIGMFGFVANDAIVKLASGALPLGQIILIRGLMGTILIGFFVASTKGLPKPRTLMHWSVAGRTICEIVSTFSFLSALIRMPIADATAIMQASPLVIMGLAVLFLNERVGWRRWLAVLAAFLGMLLIVRPGTSAFDTSALFAIVGMLGVSGRDIFARFIPSSISSTDVTLSTTLAVTLMSLSFIPFETWSAPSLASLGFLLLASVFLLCGHFFVTVATREGEVSVVAPFRYSILLWAFLFGLFIWGDVPDGLTLIGMAIIVGSGLFVFYRERHIGNG